MKTVEELRLELKEQLQDCIHVNDGSIAAQVDDRIQWAWDNWEDDIVATFYEGEKPECYNEEFRNEWIDNEPFDVELERINNPEFTYDVVFNDETDSNNKGFQYSLEDAKGYIDSYNGTNESYFEDYKGGIASVVCNETGETVYEVQIK